MPSWDGFEMQASVRNQYSPDTLSAMASNTPATRVASEQTLVDDCIEWAKSRIAGQVFRPGMRLPSIRALANARGVSPFTVAEAYGRLVAAGDLEARRGSGYYVRQPAPESRLRTQRADSRIDLRWLMRHMLESAAPAGPGLGVLPPLWLDGAQVASALRSLGRQGTGRWLDSGTPQGFEPLRSVLQQRLATLDIVARADEIVLTTGITHALNLVLRATIERGDTVLVLDPCWFGALGVLAAHGTRVVGVPCTASGPDLDALERLVAEEKPRLLVASSAAHNPTGLSLSRETASRIVDIAARYELPLFEDDAYADLCATPVARLAALDRLRHVIYAGSFSKTLAANIRVGFLACSATLAQKIADAKVLTGFTTPELNERLIHKLLIESRYDRHARTLRERLADARRRAKKLLESRGIEIFGADQEGLFLWANLATDTNRLAAAWRERGYLIAPGSLFSPQQAPTTFMRFNVTTPLDAKLKEFLDSLRS